jgi:hypothetical protein
LKASDLAHGRGTRSHSNKNEEEEDDDEGNEFKPIHLSKNDDSSLSSVVSESKSKLEKLMVSQHQFIGNSSQKGRPGKQQELD